ncbi:hypothetical protein DFJ74DRAFT_759242 [Hyaloraphidium curvatum]|nr:hypothetical protein DFJ74DRAFT_759242 [Hyaloraphidium curvatum]
MRAAAAVAAALLALCAALSASAAPIVDDGPAEQAAPVEHAVFVRSCGDCLEDSYCEFNHPDATPELPLACVTHGTDHALYKRYENLNCLDRAGISGKFYQGDIGQIVCYNLAVNVTGTFLTMGAGACPIGSGGGQIISSAVSGPITDSAPGTCMASFLPFVFGENCNTLAQWAVFPCISGPNFVLTITDPFP